MILSAKLTQLSHPDDRRISILRKLEGMRHLSLNLAALAALGRVELRR